MKTETTSTMSDPYDDLCAPYLETRSTRTTCCADDCNEPGEVRTSLGIYAGRYCDAHWETSGYRKEGREGYDYLDAGEYYDPEDAY